MKLDKVNVFVVQVSERPIEELQRMREYISDSLPHGILVLGEDAVCKMMEFPRLGMVMSAEYYEAVEETFADLPPAPEPSARAVGKTMRKGGRCADEKQGIQERLKAYREKHGLGCWAAVVKASRGKLNEAQLRDMQNGTVVFPIETWRAAGRALDRLEQKAVADG